MEGNTLLLLLLLSISLLSIFLLSQKNKNKKALYPLPPGPKPYPLVGNLLQLGPTNQPHITFTSFSKTYGPIFSLQLGQVRTIIVSSHEYAKKIFQNHDLALAGRHEPDAVRAQAHHEWSIRGFRLVHGGGPCTGFVRLSYSLLKDLILICYLESKKCKSCWILSLNPLKRSTVGLKNREEGSLGHNDFLDVLLDSQLGEGGPEFRQPLKSLFVVLFSAGTDTSSSTVEWAMAELLQNPVTMAKVRNELALVISLEKGMEESDISRLPYLQAVVKETLRLHPPVPLLLPRRAQEIVELGGYLIPEGAKLLVNVWAIGRDETTWQDPLKFRPERFLEREIDFKGRDFELIPFGAGRRICPGLPLAYRMIHLMLGSLLHQFEWKLPEEVANCGVDLSEKFGLTLAMAQHLKAIAVPVPGDISHDYMND